MVTLPGLMIPRVVETPRRSMQRLGLLKLLVAISAKRSTSTLPCVGQELIQTLTRKVDLTLTDRSCTLCAFGSLRADLRFLKPESTEESWYLCRSVGEGRGKVAVRV